MYNWSVDTRNMWKPLREQKGKGMTGDKSTSSSSGGVQVRRETSGSGANRGRSISLPVLNLGGKRSSPGGLQESGQDIDESTCTDQK